MDSISPRYSNFCRNLGHAQSGVRSQTFVQCTVGHWLLLQGQSGKILSWMNTSSMGEVRVCMHTVMTLLFHAHRGVKNF